MYNVKRILLRRLIAPLVRGKHPPEYTARGTAVGLLIAFTPTLGVQMELVFLLWVIIRYPGTAEPFRVAPAKPVAYRCLVRPLRFKYKTEHPCRILTPYS